MTDAATQPTKPAVPWYHSGIVIALGLLFCVPVGLILVWTDKRAHIVTKALATLIFGGFWALVTVGMVASSMASRRSASAFEAPITTPAVYEPAEAPAPVEPAEPTLPEGSFGNGTMVVGKDIKAGKYKSAGAAPGSVVPICYYTRLKGFSGEITDIIANEAVQPADGAVIVNIKPTDVGFQSKGCAPWVPLE